MAVVVENSLAKVHKHNIHLLVNRLNSEDLSPEIKDRLLAHITKECNILLEYYNVDYSGLVGECLSK